MQKINYQRLLEETLRSIEISGKVPKLLLHSCCAPCSSYVLTYLSEYFSITLFYDNPNIFPRAEFRRRADEVERLLSVLPVRHPIAYLEADYDPAPFLEIAKGHETDPEGGARCHACYALRLERAAKQAKALGMDYYTTTLSVSPYKHAEILNALGGRLAEAYGVPYLFSDFKKRDGYKKSIALSRQYDLYRQDYCGCAYSAAARERQRNGGSAACQEQN